MQLVQFHTMSPTLENAKLLGRSALRDGIALSTHIQPTTSIFLNDEGEPVEAEEFEVIITSKASKGMPAKAKELIFALGEYENPPFWATQVMGTSNEYGRWARDMPLLAG